MSAALLREAAATMREYGARGVGWGEPWDGDHAADNGTLPPIVTLDLADLLDALALDREMDPYLPKHFDDAALKVAKTYLGRTEQ